MLFEIETKSDKVMVEAVDRDHAFAKYFKDIATQKVPLEKLGNIIMLRDGKEEYPFRTVPLLFKMGLIPEDVAVENIVSIVGGSRNSARKMLKEAAEKDARLIPLIDEIAEKEMIGRRKG